MLKLRTLCLGMAIAMGAPAAALANTGGEKADAEFTKSDTNGDGKISAEEHAAAAQKRFEAMDANHDGKVTADEFSAAYEKVTGKKPKAGEMPVAEKIKAMDTNGDGALSAEEFTAGSKAMFDKLDANHDGFVTKQEMQAGAQNFKNHAKASGTQKTPTK